MQRKDPLRGKVFARCIPERRFAALFGYMARISCQSQLVLDAWRRYVAREGRFSRPGPLRGCMRRENCHGLPPGNASRENIATDGRPWTHHGEISPPSDVGGRNSRVSCYRRAPGNAPGHDLATTGRPRRTPPSSHATAPCTATLCIAAPPMLAPNAPAHAPRARLSFSRPARRGTTAPCAVRGAFAAAEKVSCGLRVSMRWNEPPVSV